MQNSCALFHSTSSRRVLLGLLFVVITTSAFACPGCTQERLLQSNWHIKMFIVQLATALAFTINRLDLVRVLYTFIPVVPLNLYLQKAMMWYGHPAVRPAGIPDILITLAGWAIALNIGSAAIMYAIGTLRFYRRDKEKGLPIWQPVAYAATLLVADMIVWQM